MCLRAVAGERIRALEALLVSRDATSTLWIGRFFCDLAAVRCAGAGDVQAYCGGAYGCFSAGEPGVS